MQSTGAKQRSLLSFFPKLGVSTPKRSDEDEKENKNADGPSAAEDDGDEMELPRPIAAKKSSVSAMQSSTSGIFSSDAPSPEEQNTPIAAKSRGRLRRRGEIKPSSPPVPSSPTGERGSKRVTYAESSGSEADTPRAKGRPIKRRKNTVVESGNENAGDNAADDVDDEMDDFIVPDEEDSDIPITKSKKKAPKATAAPFKNASTPTSRFSFNGNRTSTPFKTPAKTPLKSTSTPSSAAVSKPFGKGKEEVRHPWLANVKDADGNPPDHPDYDPRTLYIPPYAWNKFSPFEKQYWEIKCKNYDTIVFFRKGKFYEIFENDANVGNQEFDLKITARVNMSMVGVPEYTFDMWAAQFIARGYKVARVDQVESALGKEMREKAGGKADAIIKRELSCILTGGTLVEEGMLQDEMSLYCVSIKEAVSEEGCPCFGIAFVDTATGAFHLTEFEDDLEFTKFETFIAQIRPRELIMEKNNISMKATQILKTNTALTTIWNKLAPGKEFWEARTTIREIISAKYFSKDEPEDMDKWPEVLVNSQDKELVLSALGGLLSYLQHLKIDKDLVSIGNFVWYDPIRKATSLVLDGQTLKNLEIFANSFDGSTDGTLFTLLNRCITPFGKRMFRQWLCHPLADSKKIIARLDAIDALLADETFRETFVLQLSKLPDLERLISRIHAGSCSPKDFVRVIEGFEQIRDAMAELSAHGEGDGLIGQLVSSLPDLSGHLAPWETAFDKEKAKRDGVLVPERGVEEEFDQSQDTIEGIMEQLSDYLKKYQKDFKSKEIVFRDVGKELYLVEIPVKIKYVPKDWPQMSATAKVKRYWPPEIKRLVRSLQEAQETHSQIVKGVLGKFLAKFDKDYDIWLQTIRIVAQLDCLISLSKASVALGEPRCRPTFVEGENERSVIHFDELRHPCMLPTIGEFIPNNIHLGGKSAKITLLTGANAAGKSTVLRMSCIAVIMAQLGCYVPAQSAHLTPVDRIMSRLGANDNIFASQSTFFVELAETKKILSEATPRSLVILDELGRGTSSYDGVAVAQSVLHHIATHIGCVGFFATHYHSLATEFGQYHSEIKCGRMKIEVDEVEKRVTFLYKLEEGIAEGSFGMHCASMCGIPRRIVNRAEEAARMFEHTSRLKERLERSRGKEVSVPLGVQSDFAWLVRGESVLGEDALELLMKAIEAL